MAIEINEIRTVFTVDLTDAKEGIEEFRREAGENSFDAEKRLAPTGGGNFFCDLFFGQRIR